MTAEVATIITIINGIVGLVHLWGSYSNKKSSDQIKASLTAFELQFLEKLNGRYIRAAEAQLQFKAILDRLERVEQ